MVRQIDAIFSQGAFRPVEPVSLAEGTRVHLSVEEEETISIASHAAKVITPKLAHPKDAADFVLEVRETGHADV